MQILRGLPTGAALLAAGALFTFAQPAAAWESGRRVVEDARDYAAAPRGWDARQWGWVAAAAAGVAGIGLLDEGARSTVRDGRTPATRHAANLVRGGGELLGWGGGVVALAWAGGWALESEVLEETGFSMAEAAVLSGAAVAALKVAAGRSRPGEDRGSGTFHPFRGGLGGGRSSFPSQHAAFAFAAASAASGRHPGLGWAAYPLATLVALSRVHDDRHWLSDAAAGATIGTATGLWVAGRSRDGRATALLPWLNGDAMGIAWAARF